MGKLVRYLERRIRKDGTVSWYYNPPRDIKEAGVLLPCPLGKDLPEAIRKAEKYNEVLDGWRKDKNTITEEVHKAGTLNSLVAEYLDSRFYRKLKPTSQHMYEYCLRRLCALELKDGQKLGEVNINRIKPRSVDAIYEKLQCIVDGKPTKQTMANNIMRVASAVWSIAARWEYVPKGQNPFYDMGKEGTRKRFVTWSPSQVRMFRATAVEMGFPSVSLAFLLQYELAQRQGDVLAMKWEHYTGTHFKFAQNKTSAEMYIPVSPELKTVLDMQDRKGEYIVINETTGLPYAPGTFRNRVREIRRRAGLPEQLTSGDLRRTAATELGDAGATEAEIMATGGWTNPITVQRYKLRTSTQADNGLRKRWNKRNGNWE